MNWLWIFENALPAGATTSIAFSGAAIGGAALVYILVRISTVVKNSGALHVELTPMTELCYGDIRLEAKFFNSSHTDAYFHSFGLYQKKGHSYELIAPLGDAPIDTGGSKSRYDYGKSMLCIASGGSYFGIFGFSSPAIKKGTYYLGFKGKKDKTQYWAFTL